MIISKEREKYHREKVMAAGLNVQFKDNRSNCHEREKANQMIDSASSPQ